jgi:uncharacterized protein YjbJ (UPF0337 family)
MNWDQVEGQWDKVKGNVKSKWAKLTDDDMGQLSGKKDQLVGVIQQRYGVLKDEAEKQVHEWITKLDAKLDHATHHATEKVVQAGDKLQEKIEGSGVKATVNGNANATAKKS